MSQQFLGIYLDAVYHTALVFNNVEYFFGSGIQTCYPGATHHGRPMEIVPMGTTHLPMDTIMDYLESLKEVYTPESYDLFAHNCNNFTNDFGMFLVGKGIPDHITNLPKRVLDTPMGQMLKSQIDQSMRSITQAPSVPQSRTNKADGAIVPQGQARTSEMNATTNGMPKRKDAEYGSVINVESVNALENHLQAASSTAATIFFTSASCGPCRIAYPMFDKLAEQHSQALFAKVDISAARGVAAQYQVGATPTFMTFSRGTKRDEWTGADPGLLKANVEALMRHTFPPHPHAALRVPTLQHGSLKPVTYTKVPPLDKLMGKLGTAASEKELVALRSFVEKRQASPKDAAVPNLRAIGQTFQTRVFSLPAEVRFAAVDLLRCAMVDSRVSGFFAEEKNSQTISSLVKQVNELDTCPHNLRLVTIHLACNLFVSPLYVKEMMQPGNSLAGLLVQLVTTSLLDASHPTTRVAAASLAFNLAMSNYRIRREEAREGLNEGEQVALAASLYRETSWRSERGCCKGTATGARLLGVLCAARRRGYGSRQSFGCEEGGERSR